MPAPNLLLVGCQKSGTTWTHLSLRKSRHIMATAEKELHFFIQPETGRNWDNYLRHFPFREGARYYMETTPGYFQLPTSSHDIAADVRASLGDPKVMVIFRNPVERYESAYIHHMDKGRLPYVDEIREINTDMHQLLDLGRYGSILAHWRSHFPDIGVFFYDDIQADRMRFLSGMMAFLGLENDLTPEATDFRANDKIKKARERHPDWRRIPTLHPDTAAGLRDFYRDEIGLLQDLTQRDLSHWLVPSAPQHGSTTGGLRDYIRRLQKRIGS